MGMGDADHVIGPIEDPLLVCKKKDVCKLFTAEFDYLYQIWLMFNLGFGLPHGKSWDELDPDMMNILRDMQVIYKNNFSFENYQSRMMDVMAARPLMR